ncbi:MAG: hypothetical protein ACLT98_11680 [Eggerthellaceae bacterium]
MPHAGRITGKRIVNELTDRKLRRRHPETGQCVQITCKKALYDGGSGLRAR